MNIKVIISAKIVLLLSCFVASQRFNPAFTQTQTGRANAPTDQTFPVPHENQNRNQKQNQGRASTNTRASSYTNPFYEFNRKLFYILGPPFSRDNMVYSPISLQTLLGFIYTGAEDRTAQELQTALEVPLMTAELARLFQALLQHIKQQSSKDLTLNMVNYMYYSDKLTLNEDFYRRSKPYFEAEVEALNFEEPLIAADRINKMVASKTKQRIRNLISPGSLDVDTQAILVNAIYLKAKWATEFSAYDTQLEDFHVTPDRTAPVEMMFLEDNFNIGELTNLNAKAIELPFKNNDIRMLIILPNKLDGLRELELALGTTDLRTLSNALSSEFVTLRMPKFSFEFAVDMTAALMKLGASQLFSDNAQLDGFFQNQKARVSRVQHKAYIKVNEGGVEAAAASFGKLLPLSLPIKVNNFTIDHPFVFVIKSPEAVYFLGHVTNP